MDRRALLAGVGGLAALRLAPGTAAAAQEAPAPEKPSVALGVGGKPLLYYLPLTIAERRGLFTEQGLEVEINDFGGGSKSLQALIGGSVDVVTGAYEHTIRMQAKGQDVRAVCELGRFPGIVIAVSKGKADAIKSTADLAGATIGVTAPGSSTALTAQYALLKAGLDPTAASLIGVGGGASAVAAMKRGEIDAISHLDPVIAKLEADGDIKVLVDTRTRAGTEALFGASNPAAVLYTKGDFITTNPATTQRLVNAFVAALRWIDGASAEEIADAVPSEYHLGDKDLYIRAVRSSKESYSRDGVVPKPGQESALAMLKALEPAMKDAPIDLARTFDGQFVAQSG